MMGNYRRFLEGRGVRKYWHHLIITQGDYIQTTAPNYDKLHNDYECTYIYSELHAHVHVHACVHARVSSTVCMHNQVVVV